MSQLIYITGASSGIGQALAQSYMDRGDHVVMVARRIEELNQWCKQHYFPSERYTIYQSDVRDVDTIVSAGQRCIAEIGLPDVVIAAAGISIGIDTEKIEDIEVMRRLYETNNIGMMATFHPFVSDMKMRGSGKFVGIASVAGIRGLAGHGAYCSSKAAVISYCESFRLEMFHATGASGVQVITILPGFVATPLTLKNPYPMPFILSSTEFAQRALREIDKGKSYIVIPWQMGIVAKVLRLLPNFLYDRIFSGRQRKPREKKHL